MDRRLIVTAAFMTHLLGGGMLAIAQSTAGVNFTEGQLEFLVLIGYGGPLIAMGLIWLKNYAYGAPLLFATTTANCWFVIYFFLIHDNPANVGAVSGPGSGAYLYATIAVVVGSLVSAVAGLWLWYGTSDGFRSAVDDLVRPSETE
ncbi:hypothetical protein ACLI4R_01330 [Natrialbaceae archaeon A-chndr2]